jgi:excisionase family DNA binding protein
MRTDHAVTPDLLKPAELAARLGVSRTWLYEAARAGRIPSIRIGGREGPLRFVPEDIQRWIDEARAEWTPGTVRPVSASALERADPVARGVRSRRREHR